MREARIILPSLTQHGRIVHSDVGDWLEVQLLRHFKGFTKWDAEGVFWSEQHGQVVEFTTIYDVAMEFNNDSFIELVTIAQKLAQKADQESVYVRSAGGVVLFVKPVGEMVSHV
jgi:hypothetical protein